MKALPLVPDNCSLTPSGLAEQQARGELLRPAVQTVERSPGAMRVRFGAEVDQAVVRELVETEQGCCTFLTIDYDEEARALRVSADDPSRHDVVDLFAGFFGGDKL